MDLSLTEEQQLLAHTVREVCAKYSPPDAVRALEDDPKGFRDDLWRELAGLGLLGLTVAESDGGAGATLVEQVLVCEELGRALVASPYLVSSVLSAGLLRRDGARRAIVESIAGGDAIVSCAWVDGVPVRVDDGTVTGSKILVPFASSATHLLVRAGDDVFLVDPRGAGVAMTQQRTMAADAMYEVSFERVPAERLDAEWDSALDEALVAVAAYAVGGAARAHEMAVEYAKEREQFGKKIGSFQGIAHPLADTATDIEGARVLVWQAAWAHATGRRDTSTLSAMAKLFACDAFKRTTKTGQQTFGGIGFIRDVDMQLYFRRAKQLELLWLGPRELEERIASAELDAPTPFVAVDPAQA